MVRAVNKQIIDDDEKYSKYILLRVPLCIDILSLAGFFFILFVADYIDNSSLIRHSSSGNGIN